MVVRRRGEAAHVGKAGAEIRGLVHPDIAGDPKLSSDILIDGEGDVAGAKGSAGAGGERLSAVAADVEGPGIIAGVFGPVVEIVGIDFVGDDCAAGGQSTAADQS